MIETVKIFTSEGWKVEHRINWGKVIIAGLVMVWVLVAVYALIQA